VPDRAGSEWLLKALARQLGWPEEALKPVHRLDEGTSGVLVIARSRDDQRHLCRQFARRQVEKVYYALVVGQPAEDTGQIALPIGRKPRTPGKMRIDTREGRKALTEWRVLQRYSGMSLLECRPRTGRTHQVRLHLNAAGFPLVVDPLYGGRGGLMLSSFKSDYRASKRHPEKPLISRLTLHAAAIELAHPATGAAMRFDAPLPKDFRAALNQLQKHAAVGPVVPL
jgi:RluA family pseudouridine synthase